jgi:hypothetical protein
VKHEGDGRHPNWFRDSAPIQGASPRSTEAAKIITDVAVALLMDDEHNVTDVAIPPSSSAGHPWLSSQVSGADA